jgi:hypothetical protein
VEVQAKQITDQEGKISQLEKTNIMRVRKLKNVVKVQAKQITDQEIKISQLEKDLNELKVSFSKLRISPISENEIDEEEKNPGNDETYSEKKEETSHATFFRH